MPEGIEEIKKGDTVVISNEGEELAQRLEIFDQLLRLGSNLHVRRRPIICKQRQNEGDET